MANFTISFTIPDDKADMGNAQALCYYIKQLRYERLMAKAAFFKCSNAYYLYRNSNTRKHLWQYSNQLVRIAAAYEARAAKLKENK